MQGQYYLHRSTPGGVWSHGVLVSQRWRRRQRNNHGMGHCLGRFDSTSGRVRIGRTTIDAPLAIDLR